MRYALVLALVLGMCSTAVMAQHATGKNQTRLALNKRVPEVEFAAVPLKDAIDFLRDISGANIIVNWSALQTAGVTKDVTVNLRVRNVRLAKILQLILAEAGVGTLAYDYADGVIEVTTRELSDQKMYTIVYDVSDLLIEIPDFDAPDDNSAFLNQGNGINGNNNNNGNNGNNNNLFGGNDDDEDDDNDDRKTREERGLELVDLIKEVIYPDIWKDNGGPASIRFWRSSLVVTAPRKVHEAIGGPLP